MPIAMRGPRKAVRGKCERGQGSANADGAGAEAFAGDGYSQKASFGPMAAISRRGQGGRIYNNTRARVLLRRMCVKPAALTTHSPLKISARPRTATRPPRALPLPHAAPTHARRLRDARPQCAMHSPLPSQPIPRRRPSLAPHSDTPSQTLLLAHAAQMHARRPHDPFPAEELRPSPQRHAASPSVPLRAQKNGTAQWMCDAECLGRPSLRSVIGVGEPRAVRRRCGALAWRVGLRPQPWALRSRRCGRVLRA